MSAPPENRTGQRFTSSINIPVQNDNDTSTTQHSQPQQQSTTNERVIPIHVEGRDEPVIPKNPNHAFNQPQPQPDRVFNSRPGGFGGTWNKGDGPYYTGEPPQFRYEEPHNFYNNSHRNEAFGNSGPFKPQKPPPDAPQPQNSMQPPRQHQQPPQPQRQESPQPQQQTPPPPPPPPPTVKLGPMEQIQRIQKDVLELMNEVGKFNGQPKDKDYVYLDEMLTRNLLKLDDVETEGKDKIRNARKEAIKCIQKCISLLEAKANANELLHNQLKDISKVPFTSLEVSGVSRSGTETSIQQEDSVVPEEQSVNAETENVTLNESEPVPSSDNTAAIQEQSTEPVKPESENIPDVEMTADASNTQVSQIPEPPSEDTKVEPMEVEEPKEKKDKKKVKKKVDKSEKK